MYLRILWPLNLQVFYKEADNLPSKNIPPLLLFKFITYFFAKSIFCEIQSIPLGGSVEVIVLFILAYLTE